MTDAVDVRFFEQSRIIRALISSSSLLASSTHWIDAITFHLAVATRVARKHLPLLAGALLRRAIVAFGRVATFRRVVARPVANPFSAWRRHGESETTTLWISVVLMKDVWVGQRGDRMEMGDAA